jgi:hypothetical protein
VAEANTTFDINGEALHPMLTPVKGMFPNIGARFIESTPKAPCRSCYPTCVYDQTPEVRAAQDSQSDELRRLKADLKRVTEERDILKKAAAYFAKQSG